MRERYRQTNRCRWRGNVVRLQSTDYQGGLGHFRARPWVDRLASAWLIRRFNDPAAAFSGLQRPPNVRLDAQGSTSMVQRSATLGSRVTFEVLAASFALEAPAIARPASWCISSTWAALRRPRATERGERAGRLRASIRDDDQLLTAANARV